MTPVITPVVTLHGSSDLSDAYFDVRDDVCSLTANVENASPNGRDYYPQGPAAFTAAVKERGLVLAALKALDEELLWMAIPAEERGQAFVDAGRFTKLAAAVPEKPTCYPSIHLNGSGAKSLREECSVVFTSASAAEEGFRQVIPNGRDYNPGDWEIAREQHFERVKFVKKVGQFFMLMAMGIKAAEKGEVFAPALPTESATKVVR